VNGFHDTVTAVATVIYTHSLPAEMAVVWSGLFNFWACSLRPALSPWHRLAATGSQPVDGLGSNPTRCHHALGQPAGLGILFLNIF
jgi:hypothetical protein